MLTDSLAAAVVREDKHCGSVRTLYFKRLAFQANLFSQMSWKHAANL